MGPSALRITLQNGAEREWSEAAVRLLECRGDPLKNGAIYGLVFGAGWGSLLAAAAISWDGNTLVGV